MQALLLLQAARREPVPVSQPDWMDGVTGKQSVRVIPNGLA